VFNVIYVPIINIKTHKSDAGMNSLKVKWSYTLIGLLFFLVGCSGEKNEYIAPPPAEVTVSHPKQQAVVEYLEFTGRTEPVGFAEIKAQASGILRSMHFEAGLNVTKGDLLFVIAPELYQAEVAAAKAELISAQAEFARTEAELKRAEELIKKNFISKTDYLRRKTERDVAQAQIGLKLAKVSSAKIQLSYTQVKAPISGRVSRNRVDVGNLVGEGEATLLTTITQYRPMYAYFHLNERDLLRVMKIRDKKSAEMQHDTDTQADKELDIPLALGLADEEGFPHKGELDFGESALNTQTGTIELRGVFANREKPIRLIPGLFARLRLPVGKTENALLIDERAISSDQSGRYVLVVNQENKVEKRPVSLGQKVKTQVVIKKGIKATDKIIVNGLQRARPGSVVNPKMSASIAG